MRVALLISLGTIGGIALLSENVQAGLSRLISKEVESGDGRFVLVLVADQTLDEDLSAALDQQEAADVRRIRATYPESGLYYNDGSAKPLWTFPSSGWYGSPIIAPDGEHVIFEGSWTHDDEGYESRAVEFTKRGQVIRTYFDTNFIQPYRLKFLFNGWRPPTCAETRFDSGEMTYTIRTNQGEVFTFDVATGDLVKTSSPFPMYYGMAMTALAVPVALAIYGKWKKRRKDD